MSERAHASSTRLYLGIYAALLLGTYLTVQIAFFDLGSLNVVAALTIAFLKAIAVVLYFMHMRHSTRLTWAVAAGGLFWLGILLVLTLGDYLTRSWLTYG
jgi:cytochrome c oxidase subunit 4